jgi:hypothetical protein
MVFLRIVVRLPIAFDGGESSKRTFVPLKFKIALFLNQLGLPRGPLITPLVGEHEKATPNIWGKQENFQKSYANVIPRENLQKIPAKKGFRTFIHRCE